MVTQNEISALFITKQSLCHTGWPKNEVSDLYDVWYFQRGLDDPEQSWLFRENLAPRINNRGEGGCKSLFAKVKRYWRLCGLCETIMFGVQ